MPIYRLEHETRSLFVEAPELLMAGQGGVMPDGTYLLVVGGTVAMNFDDATFEQLQSFPVKPPSGPSRDVAILRPEIERWIANLSSPPSSIRPVDPFTITLVDFWMSLGFYYSPIFTPLHHIPFLTRTNENDVFYRWEPFPTSIKVNQSAGLIAAKTFAAPFLETQFVPTGFGAVARYALPQPFPACFRWELQPVPNDIRCGASVPMNGQSGGGVEVMFVNQTHNRGPIANPVVLPPL